MQRTALFLCLTACTVSPLPTSTFQPQGTTGPTGTSSKTEDQEDAFTFDATSGEPHGLLLVQMSYSGETSVAGITTVARTEPMKATLCEKKVAGCTLIISPKCKKACSSDEVCTYDTSCEPACVELKATGDCATKVCASDEECRYDASGKARCRIKEKFDAGKIRLGTDEDLETFNYPYASAPVPYEADALLKLRAAGFQEDAGFEGFEHDFVAISPIEADLSEVRGKDVIASTKDLTLTWRAGEHSVQIAGEVSGATFRCPAQDADGSFDIPRAVLDAVLDVSEIEAIALSITRASVSAKRGLALGGELNGAELPKEGWLVVRQSSVKMAFFTKDTEPTCGNGKLDSGEDCDTAISSGAGKCATSCNDNNACTVDTLTKNACNTRCRQTPAAVGASDQCCPSGADSNDDPDCEPTGPSCGNGVVDSGELCDTGISFGAGKCPTICNDGVACTSDVVESQNTCQARCVYSEITQTASNDGCCLAPGQIGPSLDNDCPIATIYGYCQTNSDCSTNDCLLLAGDPYGACTTACDTTSTLMRAACPLVADRTELCVSDGVGKTNRCVGAAEYIEDRGMLTSGAGLTGSVAQGRYDMYFIKGGASAETWKVTVTPNPGADVGIAWYDSGLSEKATSNVNPAGVAEELIVQVPAGKRVWVGVAPAASAGYTLVPTKQP